MNNKIRDGDEITILLVEDDDSFPYLIEKILCACNLRFSMVHCDTLTKGMNRLRDGGIDVLLLDLHLPDSGGVQTVNTVMAEYPELPVVVMTSMEKEDMEIGALDEGAQEFLPKSKVTPEALRRVIRHAIQRKNWSGANQELVKLREFVSQGVSRIDEYINKTRKFKLK